jgi:hypothetical protein
VADMFCAIRRARTHAPAGRSSTAEGHAGLWSVPLSFSGWKEQSAFAQPEITGLAASLGRLALILQAAHSAGRGAGRERRAPPPPAPSAFSDLFFFDELSAACPDLSSGELLSVCSDLSFCSVSEFGKTL